MRKLMILPFGICGVGIQLSFGMLLAGADFANRLTRKGVRDAGSVG